MRANLSLARMRFSQCTHTQHAVCSTQRTGRGWVVWRRGRVEWGGRRAVRRHSCTRTQFLLYRFYYQVNIIWTVRAQRLQYGARDDSHGYSFLHYNIKQMIAWQIKTM
jgi:hypothetical protein